MLHALGQSLVLHRLIHAYVQVSFFFKFFFFDIPQPLTFCSFPISVSFQCSFISYFINESAIKFIPHLFTSNNPIFEKKQNYIYSFNQHVDSDNDQTEMHIKQVIFENSLHAKLVRVSLTCYFIDFSQRQVYYYFDIKKRKLSFREIYSLALSFTAGR